jgi:hypothetical protein
MPIRITDTVHTRPQRLEQKRQSPVRLSEVHAVTRKLRNDLSVRLLKLLHLAWRERVIRLCNSRVSLKRSSSSGSHGAEHTLVKIS